MTWSKGQSGNPGGRPLGRSGFSDVLWKLIELSPEELIAYKPTTVKEQIIKSLLEMATNKELSAMREAFDRTEGKPEQRQIHVGEEGSPPIEVLLRNATSTDIANAEADGGVEPPREQGT